jgi:hypothetical protein
MHCHLCHKNIGLMRRLTDREFCCDAHRSLSRAPSARALRDQPDLNEEFEEAWLDHAPAKASRAKANSSVGQSTITALGLSVLGVIIVAMMDQSGSHAPSARASGSGSNAIWQTMQGALERIPKPKPQVRLQDDFHAGLRRWQGAGGSTSDWGFSDVGVKLGSLKIWEDSKDLTDYRLEFEGQIEKKSLGWAFRANDSRNYYASKINISRTPGSPSAEIVRFSMLRGRESKRISLPLPIAIDKATPYHVQVKVKGDKFITAIDGQVVDVWQDARLSKGGIGFFNEKGESASIRWVSVSDADRFLEKLRSYLYLSFIAPYSI